MSDNPAIESLHDLNLNRYYRIYTTVHEMLQSRGYTPLSDFLPKDQWISNYLGLLAELDDDDCELDEFGMIDQMTLLFKRGKKQLLVYFHPFDSKLAQKDMNAIHALMGEKNAQHLVIVANNRATPKVSSVLGILGHNAQLFSEHELHFSIPKHQLIPKHVLVDDEERKHILESYAKLPDGKIHPEVLPGMYTTDPVARYYNYKVDDLIRIERPRVDGFVDITYRIVTYPMADEK